jgi:hypothetical protein
MQATAVTSPQRPSWHGSVETKLKLDSPLVAAACFAMAWVMARACIQSVTLDEADSYLMFATTDWPAHWYPSSGNHVLYTILARIVTSLFGLSDLTLRVPALLGAAVYIGSAYGLCVWIASERVIRWPLFVCLVYNPFIMDYLVAARGYSLALGFLMSGLLLAARSMHDAGRSQNAEPVPMAASACIGLSLTANFSFGYIDAAALLALAIWACRRTGTIGWRPILRSVTPALIVVFVICGHTILNFPKSQLYHGATSVREMWKGLIADSFDELNPFVVNPVLERCLQVAATILPYLFVAVCILQIAGIAASGEMRKTWREDGRLFWAAGLLGMTALAASVHWLAFRLAKIPLPKDRTAIFFVPLCLLILGAAVSVPADSRFCKLLHAPTVAILIAGSIYFAGCLRLSHFREWIFDADVKGGVCGCAGNPASRGNPRIAG